MDTLHIPTELEAADATLRRLADDLTAALRRTHPEGTVSICLGTRWNHAFVALYKTKHDYSGTFCNGGTLDEAVVLARLKIADLGSAERAGWLALGVDPDTLQVAA